MTEGWKQIGGEQSLAGESWLDEPQCCSGEVQDREEWGGVGRIGNEWKDQYSVYRWESGESSPVQTGRKH